jgi:protein gp37
MGADHVTSIEWTNDSWNPIRARDLGSVGAVPGPGWHCEIVSPGCNSCYAQAINRRRGTRRPYVKTSRPHVHVYLDEKVLTQPLRWKRPRRIFVASMSDLFGEWVPDEMIDRIIAVMAKTPHHTYQVLTKRHERMRDYLRGDAINRIIALLMSESGAAQFVWPLPNMWAGVSVEDQRRADERIPVLLETPAAMRWVSAEPLLEMVDLWGARFRHPGRLDWVVVGGESGANARPFNIDWARSIMRQCRSANVPIFIKQMGSHPINNYGAKCGFKDRKGGDISEFPPDLRIREYPT